MTEYRDLLGAEMRDTERLALFMLDTRDILQDMIQAREILFPHDQREVFLRAFEDLLEYQWDETYYRLRDGDVNEEQLQQHGLTGVQLVAKLTGYTRVRDRFIRRGGLRLLGPVIKWLNTLLGSLAQVLPVAGAIQELKEAIENVIEDSEGGHWSR